MSMVANAAAKKKKKASQSKEARAGLTYPVSRMKTKLKQKKVALRVGEDAAIWLAAVAEHVTSHVMEAAQEYARQDLKDGKGKPRRLTINDLVQSVRTDPDTARLFADFVFSTHLNAIKPGKVQQLIMTKKDFDEMEAKKEAAKAVAAAKAAKEAKKGKKP